MTQHKAILGIDAAQAGIAYRLIDTNNNVLAQARASSTNTSLAQLGQTLAAHKLRWPEVLVAIESTGPWHLHWSEKLHELGARVYVLNPLVAKRTHTPDNAIRDYKSDPIDAAGLCELLLREHQRLGRFLYQREHARLRLQRLQSARQAVRANLTNLKKAHASLLALVFPELRALGLGEASQHAVLAAAPTPAAILALEAREIETLAGKKAPALRQAAATSFAQAGIAQATAPALVQLGRTIQAMENEIETFDRLIENNAPEALGAGRIARAQSLPGFGKRTTLAILANLPGSLLDAPISRRAKANKIQAQIGCEPRMRQSGQWTGKLKISKRGEVKARVALYQAASCAVIHNEPMKTIYRGLRARGKPHKVAIYDIGRRLIRQLVAVLETKPQPIPNCSCQT